MKVNGRLIVQGFALAGLLLFVAVAAGAQGGGSAAAPVTSKIGVLNVRQAIVSTAEGKQASAELQSRFTAPQTELDNIRKQVEDLQGRLRTGERTLSDEEKARLSRQVELLTRQGQRKQDDLQEEVNAAQGEVIERISRKMGEVLERYARENGFAAILDTSAQGATVIYASPQVDITQDIIRLYDQANPVKAAAPAPTQPRPQPALPRPAQQQPPAKPPQQ